MSSKSAEVPSGPPRNEEPSRAHSVLYWSTSGYALATAGCGKGQRYHYFNGKADLVAAVIERQLELVLAARQPELDHTDSWEGIQAWMARILRAQSRRGGPFACPLETIAADPSRFQGQVSTRIRDRGRQPELALEFVAPLVDKSRRNDHQHSVGEPAHS